MFRNFIAILAAVFAFNAFAAKAGQGRQVQRQAPRRP
jgi:hypothetical protein